MAAAPEPLLELTIAGATAHPHLAWAEGLGFRLPAGALRRLGLEQHLAGETLRLPAAWQAGDCALAPDLRERAAFTDRRPLSSRLPFSYQAVPGWARDLWAKSVGRLRRKGPGAWATFPAWPLDLSADLLADLAGKPSREETGPTPLVLSHDIDTAEGLRNLIDRFLPLEEAVGARSSNYVVPCAWRVDDAMLHEVAGRGHELGIHGYDHANRTPFASPADLARRLDEALPLARRHGMTGYRAPSLLRTRALLAGLATRYRYDSSIPTSGGMFPVPNNGCASARPFRCAGILELPLSLPRDGSLRFLGYSPAAILALWQDCAGRIARARGLVILLTHCEARFSGNPEMLAIYRDFLAWAAADPRFRFATAAQAADAATA